MKHTARRRMRRSRPRKVSRKANRKTRRRQSGGAGSMLSTKGPSVAKPTAIGRSASTTQTPSSPKTSGIAGSFAGSNPLSRAAAPTPPPTPKNSPTTPVAATSNAAAAAASGISSSAGAATAAGATTTVAGKNNSKKATPAGAQPFNSAPPAAPVTGAVTGNGIQANTKLQKASVGSTPAAGNAAKKNAGTNAAKPAGGNISECICGACTCKDAERKNCRCEQCDCS